MNNDFNGKYLKNTEKEEIIFKQKSPLLYKKKGNDLPKIEPERYPKESPTILQPLYNSNSFSSDEAKKAQLEKEIQAKKKSINEANIYNSKLQQKISSLQESLADKDNIIKEIEDSISSFELENRRLQDEIEEKSKQISNEPRRERRRLGELGEYHNNLLNILMNIRRLRQTQEENQYPNPDNMTYEELLELEEKMGNVSKGLSPEDIGKIKMKRYSSELYQNDKCVICQFEFKEGEQVKVLSCDHCFHQECIDEWLKKEKKCPFCKKEIHV